MTLSDVWTTPKTWTDSDELTVAELNKIVGNLNFLRNGNYYYREVPASASPTYVDFIGVIYCYTGMVHFRYDIIGRTPTTEDTIDFDMRINGNIYYSTGTTTPGSAWRYRNKADDWYIMRLEGWVELTPGSYDFYPYYVAAGAGYLDIYSGRLLIEDFGDGTGVPPL